MTRYPDAETLYAEPFPPQTVFSYLPVSLSERPQLVWSSANDEWHLFDQHNPYGWGWVKHARGTRSSKTFSTGRASCRLSIPEIFDDWCFSGSAVGMREHFWFLRPGERYVSRCLHTRAWGGGGAESASSSATPGPHVTEVRRHPVVKHSRPSTRKLAWHYPSPHGQGLYYEPEGSARSPLVVERLNLAFRSASTAFRMTDLFELPVGPAERSPRVLSAADVKMWLVQFDGRQFVPNQKTQVLGGGHDFMRLRRTTCVRRRGLADPYRLGAGNQFRWQPL